jgi:hypothetical protein
MKNKYFIVTYTASAKNYCDVKFFERFNKIVKDSESLVVDNTSDNGEYFNRLCSLTKNVIHLDIPIEPVLSIFQRKVAKSVSKCREEFLKSDCDYMLIIESDVVPPENVIELFDRALFELKIKLITNIQIKPVGIVGGLYYQGFHDYTLKGLNQINHVLSGCSIYSRDLLEKYPFRYDEKNLAAFSDAWICLDAGLEFSFWNDHDIKCEHLEIYPGRRQV